MARQLADVIEPFTIKLKFIPKGKGKHDDLYYLETKENICVCCGTQENLTKHHCVPRCFRNYFPPEYKNHRSHDILLLCIACHSYYEPHAENLKAKLAEQYNIPHKFGCSFCNSREFNEAVKAAYALFRYGDQIPSFRTTELIDKIREFLKCEPTQADIEQLAAKVGPIPWGQQIVGMVEIPEFEKLWRAHFVQIMQPKFLPKHWSVDHWDAPSRK